MQGGIPSQMTSTAAGAVSTSKQLACVPCRSAKVKCVPTGETSMRASGDACLRCVKHCLQCELPTRKKRRRIREGSQEASSAGHESPIDFSVPASSAGLTSFPRRWSPSPHPWDVSQLVPTQTAAVPDFFSSLNTHSGGSSSANPLVSVPPREPDTVNVHPSDDFFSLLPTQHAATSFRGASPPSGKNSSPLSPRNATSHTSDHKRPLAGMSIRQQLQEVKDDLGIPATRDVSRNASPEILDGQLARDRFLDQDRLGMPESARLAADHGPTPSVSGVLSAEEVVYLFERYYEYHNTCIGLLDPALHTPLFTNSVSPLLFYAILAVAAEVHLSDRYPILWQRTKTMINQAFAAAEESVELCQAVSLVCLWNDVEDRSGLLRFGFAVRIAHHMGLDRLRSRSLPQDELAARTELVSGGDEQAHASQNRERTWIVLSNFDTVLNGMYGGISCTTQPRSFEEIEAWIADHPQFPCSSDLALLINSSLAPILAIMSSPKESKLEALELRDRMGQLRSLRVDWSMRWFGRKPPGGRPTGSIRTYLRWLEKGIDRGSTIMARLAAKKEDRAEHLWNDIYAAIESIREVSTDLSPGGLLFWATNSTPLHVSKCAMLLTKHITLLPPATARCVVDIFEDIYQASLLHAAVGSRKVYLAKLFGSLIKISLRRLGSISTLSETRSDDSLMRSLPIINAFDQLTQWPEDASFLDLQVRTGLDAPLDASIDDFVLQFLDNGGLGDRPGGSVSDDDALLGGVFSYQ